MAFQIFLTEDAATDLKDIYAYIARHDSPQKAESVLDHFEEKFNGLSEFPEKGVCPGELAQLGIRDYREVFFKPYRIIYKVIENRVYIYLIADGRRDMQSLLQRRLLSNR